MDHRRQSVRRQSGAGTFSRTENAESGRFADAAEREGTEREDGADQRGHRDLPAAAGTEDYDHGAAFPRGSGKLVDGECAEAALMARVVC